MGQPVIHFEVIGKDGAKLQGYYAELFGWEIETNNPLDYGAVAREGNGIAGGIASGPNSEYPGHVTVYVEVPDVEAALSKAEILGGARVLGPRAGAWNRPRTRPVHRPRGASDRPDEGRRVAASWARRRRSQPVSPRATKLVAETPPLGEYEIGIARPIPVFMLTRRD